MVKAAESTSDEESGAVEELIDRLVAQFPEVRPDTVRDIVNASGRSSPADPSAPSSRCWSNEPPVSTCARLLRRGQPTVRKRYPVPVIAQKCTKTSGPPPSGGDQPEPFSALNHLTVP